MAPVNELALFSDRILDFTAWLKDQVASTTGSTISPSIRDYLGWTRFIRSACAYLGAERSFIHGGRLAFTDGLGVSLGGHASIRQLQAIADTKLVEMSGIGGSTEDMDSDVVAGRIEDNKFIIDGFAVPLGPMTPEKPKFAIDAPTTRTNLLRVMRALQLDRAILLEGSPGVGKTSLVQALSQLSGRQLLRINLSDQTDLTELFGSDCPVDGGKSGEFEWRDAPFLDAMKNGHWVLLDEINLASQSVLEGLNAVLDHRQKAYVPELDMEFSAGSGFRIFAAQNPVKQGGGRKGLPKSFMNRFTQVFVDELQPDDYRRICYTTFPNVDCDLIDRIVEFNWELKRQVVDKKSFGIQGGPWEFNLRDILRWIELIESVRYQGKHPEPGVFLDALYTNRMRTAQDRDAVRRLFVNISANRPGPPVHPTTLTRPV